MTTVGTFGTGIAALIGLFKVIKNVTYRDETLYGEEAVERFRKIEDKLRQERLIGVYPFAGGAAAIIPQLKITRLQYNPQTMPPNTKVARKRSGISPATKLVNV
jgi:hypothetical protein